MRARPPTLAALPARERPALVPRTKALRPARAAPAPIWLLAISSFSWANNSSGERPVDFPMAFGAHNWMRPWHHPRAGSRDAPEVACPAPDRGSREGCRLAVEVWPRCRSARFGHRADFVRAHPSKAPGLWGTSSRSAPCGGIACQVDRLTADPVITCDLAARRRATARRDGLGIKHGSASPGSDCGSLRNRVGSRGVICQSSQCGLGHVGDE